ncbi:MAG: glycosyltransferase family 2 protein [Colwellia sp.]
MIDIVLATFNGDEYLQAQVRSIQLNKNYVQLIERFIIIDDGSTDKTLHLLTKLAKRDSKIEIHHNHKSKRGVIGNFNAGLQLTTADYVMLSDQDDIWLKDKIQESVDEVNRIQVTTKKPIVVFTDKKIVDNNLNTLHESDYDISLLAKDWHHNIEQLLQRNVVSGCTMLMNRALLDIALPIPEKAFMHDWWLALMACHYGKIALVDKPHMLYRQHESNVVGARKKAKLPLLKNAKLNYKVFADNFEKTMQQALTFEQRTQQKFKFTKLYQLGVIEILTSIFVSNMTGSGLLRKCALAYFLLKKDKASFKTK